MPQKHGKRLKMYYIAQFGTSPPRIAIEINDRNLVTRDFGFYVENRLRAQFGLEGVPSSSTSRASVDQRPGTSGFVVLLVLAYLCGSIPFGVVIGKLFYGVDVREHGSGNVGHDQRVPRAGQAGRGRRAHLRHAQGVHPGGHRGVALRPWFAIFIAAAPVVGHMYSVFLKFGGGKGIATGAGVVLALVPLVFVIIFTVWIVLLLTTR